MVGDAVLYVGSQDVRPTTLSGAYLDPLDSRAGSCCLQRGKPGLFCPGIDAETESLR